MKTRTAALAIVAGLMIATVANGAHAAIGDGTCNTGEFCAYDGSGYETILLESKAAAGSNAVDVANDRVSSWKNTTTSCWQGITVRTGLPDQTVLNAYKNTSQTNPSDTWNNKIDHFDVRSSC